MILANTEHYYIVQFIVFISVQSFQHPLIRLCHSMVSAKRMKRGNQKHENLHKHDDGSQRDKLLCT